MLKEYIDRESTISNPVPVASSVSQEHFNEESSYSICELFKSSDPGSAKLQNSDMVSDQNLTHIVTKQNSEIKIII